MKSIQTAGVDPGLVHIGAVTAVFIPEVKKIIVRHAAIPGAQVQEVKDFVVVNHLNPRTWIEEYRPRAHFGTDKKMVAQLVVLRQLLPKATVLSNTGIKKVVKPDLLKLLGLWKFSTPSHHGDVRSAARIMVLGMLKEDDTNELLTAIVKDHLEGVTWNVEHR